MSYEQIKDLPSPEFKRLCGVHIATFVRMVEVLEPELARTGKKGGQPKLSVEDHLLVALEYWRGAGDAPPPGSIEHTFISAKAGVSMNQQYVG
uniref:hypothetical protein n=1 Tax=Calothrix sp. 336/3 TaxID=1337936 RepID=UPI0009E4218E|nr:hypothetical protein [Calothrix sp. 336/3]